MCLRLLLVVVLVCLFVPVVVIGVDHDSDCEANHSCHDCFCLCHISVFDLPLQPGFLTANDNGSVFTLGSSRYSLLLVSYIFRPPAV